MKKNSVVISSGWAKGMGLATPLDQRTRPTASRVREAIFSSFASILPNCRFLDLFAGSGAMGIEAASRGASQVLFIEADPMVARLIRNNLSELRRRAQVQGLPIGKYEVLEGDVGGLWTVATPPRPSRGQRGPDHQGKQKREGAFMDLGRLRALGPFDVVYIDPPYADAAGLAASLLTALESLLSPGAHLAYETKSGQDAVVVQEFVEASAIYDLIQVKKYGASAVTIFQRKGAS